MRPSFALDLKRNAVREAASRFRAANPSPRGELQHRQLEQAERGALQEAQPADAPHLGHLQFEHLLGLRLQPPDLAEGEAQALDQRHVAQALGDETGIARGLAVQRPLLRADLPAQQAAEEFIMKKSLELKAGEGRRMPILAIRHMLTRGDSFFS